MYLLYMYLIYKKSLLFGKRKRLRECPGRKVEEKSQSKRSQEGKQSRNKDRNHRKILFFRGGMESGVRRAVEDFLPLPNRSVYSLFHL